MIKSRSSTQPRFDETIVDVPVGFSYPNQNYPRHNEPYEFYHEAIDTTVGRRGWNPCSHEKDLVEPFQGRWTQADYIGNYGAPTYYRCDTSAVYDYWHWPYGAYRYDPGIGWIPHGPSISMNVGEYCSRSLAAMMPGIRPRLSILNSIYELKDFKSLPRTIRRCKSLIKGVYNRAWTLRKLLRGGSDVYLQSQFNVLPLLSDITGLYRAVVNTRKQINSLLANEAKINIRHYGCPLGDDVCPLDNRSTNTPSNSSEVMNRYGTYACTIYYRKETTYATRMFHSQLMYSYTLTDAEREHALIRGMLDSLGVQLNPQIIWNAIPWSFVVDWVVGVSQWLSAFKIRNLEPVTLIQGFAYSVKAVGTVDLFYRHNMHGCYDTGEIKTMRCKFSRYYRVNGNALFVNWFRTSGLSPKEFSLAAALLLSR